MIGFKENYLKKLCTKESFHICFTITKFPTDRVCEKSTRTNIKKKIYLMENSTVKIKLRKCKEKNQIIWHKKNIKKLGGFK